jgi:2-phospho-L-lactate guanylyltransferase
MVTILVPVRGSSISKQRIRSDSRDPTSIDSLVLTMTKRVFEAISELSIPNEVYLLTADRSLPDELTDYSFKVVYDDGFDLNIAISNAIKQLKPEKYIIVMGDLPNVSSILLTSIYYLLQMNDAVICPSHDGGTSILAARDSATFRFSYGPHSASLYLSQFQENQFRYTEIESIASWYDIDLIGDLSRLKEEDILPPQLAKLLEELD